MEQFNYYQYIARKFETEQKRIAKEIAFRERQERYKEQLCLCN